MPAAGNLWKVWQQLVISEVPEAVEAVKDVYLAFGKPFTFDGQWFVNLGDAVTVALAEGADVSKTDEDDKAIAKWEAAWPDLRSAIVKMFAEG